MVLNLDDPANVNSFLQVFGGTPIPETTEIFDTDLTNKSGSNGDTILDDENNGATSNTTSPSPGPQPGIGAPPTTPATLVAIGDSTVDHLQSIQETDDEHTMEGFKNTKIGLHKSKFAHSFAPQQTQVEDQPPFMSITGDRISAMAANVLVKPHPSTTPTQLELIGRKTGDIHRFEGTGVSDFGSDDGFGTEPIINHGSNDIEENSNMQMTLRTHHTSSTFADDEGNKTNGEASQFSGLSHSLLSSSDKLASITNLKMFNDGENPNPIKDDDHKTQAILNNLNRTEKFLSETKAKSHKFLTHAMARKIILSGLPRTADHTMVQDLIYGGSIERIAMISTGMKLEDGQAQVTFTDGDACIQYYEENKSDIAFRFKGKKYRVKIEMAKDTDYLSELLQGYLDCGASRVVHVAGVDEEFNMAELRQLAEGQSREIESIMDIYRSGTRSIVFRFTNIVDAVQFKGQLGRDDTWDQYNAHFMLDPCSKATGIRVE